MVLRTKEEDMKKEILCILATEQLFTKEEITRRIKSYILIFVAEFNKTIFKILLFFFNFKYCDESYHNK